MSRLKKIMAKIAEAENHFYALPEPVTATIRGRDCAPPSSYITRDAVLDINVKDKNLVIITANPFPASARLWNGPNLLPDNKMRSMIASLYHDLIWGHADELAMKWGMTPQSVRIWGNRVLFCVWSNYATSWSAKLEARAAYAACTAASRFWPRIKKVIGLAVICVAFTGCAAPSWDCDIDNADIIRGVICDDAGDIEIYDTPALDWCYGGFDGASAIEVDSCRVDMLRVRAGALTYKWVSGGCEALGARDSDDYTQTVACLFCEVGGRWRGGKFDWVSTSRERRELENILAGYNGWRPGDLAQASRFAFCVASRDGSRRSNIIFAESR